MMRTANPALNDKTFEKFGSSAPAAGRHVVLDVGAEPGFEVASVGDVMTIQGTVGKTAMLLAILAATAWFTWSTVMSAMAPVFEGAAAASGFAVAGPWMIGGAIGGFVVALVICFKQTWAPFLAPVYAALEGLFLGGISAVFETMYPGIAFQAIALTFGTLFALLLAYRSGLIRATENFKLGVVAATGGIFVVYAVGWIMSMFGAGIPYIHESGLIGIGFSAFVVVIAALNLVLDFDFIENGAERGAPKFMEWYAAFGLLVTLVWLYVEILRLLSKLRSRD